MQLRLFGTRGSFPYAGLDASHYGGNTSCVVISQGDDLIILDAGTGILHIPREIWAGRRNIHILLTHLHLDHIQGLAFFKPMFNPETTIHIRGPKSHGQSLKDRLSRYLSPPIFPVHFRELPCNLILEEIGSENFTIGPFNITSEFICHPGPTVAFRISNSKSVIAYFPDHEPVINPAGWEYPLNWISGSALAKDADILLHDSQYTQNEYLTRVGWGHCSYADALHYARLTGAKKLLLFHHDPEHSDEKLENFMREALLKQPVNFEVELAREGSTFHLD